MYIDYVPNKKLFRAIYLRESRRDGKKVIKKTISNITHWEPKKISALRLVLNGETRIGTESFKIIRSLPHGNVTAVLGTMKRLNFSSLLSLLPKKRNLILALIADRIITHQSKYATAKALNPQTAKSTLFQELKLSIVTTYDLYAAMDSLLKKKTVIEKQLAKKHLKDNALVLYDLTSVYFEGTKCLLTRVGHSKEGKKGTLQIMVGLLTNKEGIPIATEVFEGNVLDHTTLVAQVQKVSDTFGITKLIIVGDRGTIISKRIEELKKIEGLAFLTALKSREIQALIIEGSLKLSVFDETDLAEIQSPLYPNERLVCCRNLFLAKERYEKREALLQATGEELKKIGIATRSKKRSLKGKANIGLRVGKVIGKYKMGKHFDLTIKSTEFSYQRDEASIQREQLLDGVYIIRTPLSKEDASSSEVVTIYKGLAVVERAFRCMKTTDLQIRPVCHHLSGRVKAHVFLCMLAYYVEWHMRQLLAPLLFEDEDKEEAQKARISVVAKAVRSDKAKRKDAKKVTDDGFPVQSYQSLLLDLGTLTRNTVAPKLDDESLTFEQNTEPTVLQKKALDLLQVSVYL